MQKKFRSLIYGNLWLFIFIILTFLSSSVSALYRYISGRQADYVFHVCIAHAEHSGHSPPPPHQGATNIISRRTIQIMQYYYAINRASRSRPPRAVIVTPRTFRPCSLHAPRIILLVIHRTQPRSLPPRIFALSHFAVYTRPQNIVNA